MLCTSAGCAGDGSEPAQGDVRLVDLDDITANTQPCDAVHFGGVEVFNDGQWGRVCAGRFGGDTEDFSIDAKVVCKQLSFPFGTIYDVNEVTNSTGTPVGSDYSDYSAPGEIVWATDVLCTGKEERLDECFFPEDFGDARNDYSGPPVSAGIRRSSCRRQDGSVLGVVCRQFEIEGGPLLGLCLCLKPSFTQQSSCMHALSTTAQFPNKSVSPTPLSRFVFLWLLGL